MYGECEHICRITCNLNLTSTELITIVQCFYESMDNSGMQATMHHTS